MDTPGAVVTFPMHGQRKLSTEGYRTRDGHLIEWFGRKLLSTGFVDVVSRPEPAILAGRRATSHDTANNTRAIDDLSWRMPIPPKRRWWVTSLGSYSFPQASSGRPVMIWNPLAFISNVAQRVNDAQTVGFDVLDNWLVHHNFQGIRDYVRNAYGIGFARADFVVVNSEATLELARTFGRNDAVLIPNGVDADRFDPTPRPKDYTPTVGYIGKIGERVDLSLIESVCSNLRGWRFVIAGPIVDRGYRTRLGRIDNVELLGDVKYSDVPSLLQSFDVGWVPHRVGDGEVGGDAIKIYEYRAAGLPVLTTPIIGAGRRGLDEVHVLNGGEHAAWLCGSWKGSDRVPRSPCVLPDDMLWSKKADYMLARLGLD